MRWHKRALAALMIVAGAFLAITMQDIDLGLYAGLAIAAAGVGWLVLGRR